MKTKLSLIPAILLAASTILQAQDRPIGNWRAHMSYNNAVSAATNGVTLFAASDQSFYTFNAAQQEISAYSKVEGMADVGVSFVDYDSVTGTAIIVYNNTNLDLFRDETFYNLPEIKNRQVTGLKRINHIVTDGGLSYLSTSFGIVVVNLGKKEIKETYNFVLNGQALEVKSVAVTPTQLYAITANGLYRAQRNNPNLQAFSSWSKIHPGTSFVNAAGYLNTALIHTSDSLFLIRNDTLAFLYRSPWQIIRADPMGADFWLNEYRAVNFNGVVRKFDQSAVETDSFNVRGKPNRTVVLSDGSVWVADAFNGLAKRNGNEAGEIVLPSGPVTFSSYDILPNNGELWVAHGGYNDNWDYVYNRRGFSHFKDGKWTQYNENTVPALQGTTDFISIAKDPSDGTIYAGAYRSGLFIMKPDGSNQLLRENSILEPTIGDPTAYRVGGLTFDQGGHLWFTMAGAGHEIGVRTKEGNYYKFSGGASGMYAAYPIVDDYNQKWYIVPGNGIAVYDDNFTPDNAADDKYQRFATTQISNVVNSLIKDKDGALWFGTSDGIGVINCPGQMLSGTCQIDRPIVQYDQFAGYLFQNENVRALAVDGANRKWVGTSNGVWLISPDGDKIIYRFTVENSPLPSNMIQKIAVDPVTGDVYIGTSQGLVSYRSTATEGGETNADVVSFPNPVPSGYSGTIAIRGLVENADVRITDVSGQMVFRTTAYGGQAVWNGKDYTGKRPQSGVYLIFVTNKDGSQTHSGKLVFME